MTYQHSDASSHRAWVAPVPTPEERAAKLLAAERAAERDRWWDIARTIGQCFFWMAIGLFFVAWAVHTTDLRWAETSFWGGLVIGNSGIVMSLLAHYRRGAERGD